MKNKEISEESKKEITKFLETTETGQTYGMQQSQSNRQKYQHLHEKSEKPTRWYTSTIPATREAEAGSVGV